MALRLPTAQVTVVLGPDVVRRRLMDLLDDDTGRGADGRAAAVVRVRARADEPVADRRERLAAARGAALVLVDRLTDGLAATGRRAVLADLAALAAAGPAVLVDDADSVAALAVADGTLCADPVRGLVVEPVDALGGYLAS